MMLAKLVFGAFLLCTATLICAEEVTDAQQKAAEDRITKCLQTKLPSAKGHAVEPYTICQFRGLEAWGNSKNDIKDVTPAIVTCLKKDYKNAYPENAIKKAKACLKEALAKPLPNN